MDRIAQGRILCMLGEVKRMEEKRLKEIIKNLPDEIKNDLIFFTYDT